MTDLPELRASVALAAYAESLAEGRRVIVLGDASSGLGEHLIARGARLVHVYDPDRARAAAAAACGGSPNITYAPLDDGGLALRDGAFDLGLIENVALLADAARDVARLARALSPRAAALIATPNPEAPWRLLPEASAGGLDYYGLYDLAAAAFDEVRMLGQTPFVGYAVVDFGAQESEPDPALDSAFLPSGAEEPEWFVALGSREPIALEAFAVVQLPLSGVQSGSAHDLSVALRGARVAEAKANERVAALEAELSEAHASEARAASAREAKAEVASLRGEAALREAFIVELEARATTADARADEAESELASRSEADPETERLRSELAELQARMDREARGRAQRAADDAKATHAAVTALDAELAKARNEALTLSARIAELEADLKAAAAAKLALVEAKPALVEAKPALVEAEPAAAEAEVATLEAQLRERGQTLSKRERDLRDAERVGRDLVRQLDALAARNAELEADLAAARWRIDSLGGSSEAEPGQTRPGKTAAPADRAKPTAERGPARPGGDALTAGARALLSGDRRD